MLVQANHPGAERPCPFGCSLKRSWPCPSRTGGSGKPTDLNISLRELLSRLYPGQRTPRPTEYWPRLMQAVHALDSDEARIPILDPDTGRHEMRRIVSVGGVPRGAGHLDDNIRIIVDLPRGIRARPPGVAQPGQVGLEIGTRVSAPAEPGLRLARRWQDVNPSRQGRGPALGPVLRPLRGMRHSQTVT